MFLDIISHILTFAFSLISRASCKSLLSAIGSYRIILVPIAQHFVFKLRVPSVFTTAIVRPHADCQLNSATNTKADDYNMY